MTNCRSVESKLSAYLDSFLPSKDRVAVEAHVAECPACRQLVREVRFVRDLASDLPGMEPPASLASRIDRIPWETVQDRPRISPVATRFGVALLATAAALVMVVVRPGPLRGGSESVAELPETPAPAVVEVHRLVLPETRHVGADPRWGGIAANRGVPLEGPSTPVASAPQRDREEMIWQEVRRVSACSRRSF